MRLKEQPEHWPSASYTRRYRNFLLWGSLFGEPILQRGVGKRTLQDTISTMASVKSMLNSWPDPEQEFPADEYTKPLDAFIRVRNALDVKKNNFHMIINCHDNWLVYSHDEEISDGKGGKVLSREFSPKDWLGFMSTRPLDTPFFQPNATNSYESTGMYHDTRIQDQKVYMSHTMTCHERPSMRGYTWENKFTGKEETVYCPNSFPMWNGRHIADRQSSTFASMKGKTFKDVKEYAAAGTVLHEVTHSEKTLGDYATEGETREISSPE